MKKKLGGGRAGMGGGSRWGVRVDVNGEVKFCENSWGGVRSGVGVGEGG